jgi:hypothetical protein
MYAVVVFVCDLTLTSLDPVVIATTTGYEPMLCVAFGTGSSFLAIFCFLLQLVLEFFVAVWRWI